MQKQSTSDIYMLAILFAIGPAGRTWGGIKPPHTKFESSQIGSDRMLRHIGWGASAVTDDQGTEECSPGCLMKQANNKVSRES